MGAPIVTAAIIGGAASLISGIFGSSSASKRAKRADREKRRLTGELDQTSYNKPLRRCN